MEKHQASSITVRCYIQLLIRIQHSQRSYKISDWRCRKHPTQYLWAGLVFKCSPDIIVLSVPMTPALLVLPLLMPAKTPFGWTYIFVVGKILVRRSPDQPDLFLRPCNRLRRTRSLMHVLTPALPITPHTRPYSRKYLRVGVQDSAVFSVGWVYG